MLPPLVLGHSDHNLSENANFQTNFVFDDCKNEFQKGTEEGVLSTDWTDSKPRQKLLPVFRHNQHLDNSPNAKAIALVAFCGIISLLLAIFGEIKFSEGSL